MVARAYLDTVADIESSGNPNARAKTSTAAGLFGMTKKTYNELRAADPELKDISFEDHLKDTSLQKKAAEKLTAKNQEVLTKNGIEPNPFNTYVAHNLGPSVGKKVLLASNDQNLADVLPRDFIDANPQWKNQTVGQYKAGLENKFAKTEGPSSTNQPVNKLEQFVNSTLSPQGYNSKNPGGTSTQAKTPGGAGEEKSSPNASLTSSSNALENFVNQTLQESKAQETATPAAKESTTSRKTAQEAIAEQGYGTGLDSNQSSEEPSLKQAFKNIVGGLTNKKSLQETGRAIVQTAKDIPGVGESIVRGAATSLPAGAQGIESLARTGINYVAPGSVKEETVLPSGEKIRAAIPRLTEAKGDTGALENVFEAVGGLGAGSAAAGKLSGIVKKGVEGTQFLLSPAQEATKAEFVANQAAGRAAKAAGKAGSADQFAGVGDIPAGASVGSKGKAFTHEEQVSAAKDNAKNIAPDLYDQIKDIPANKINPRALDREVLARKHGLTLTEGEREQNIHKLSDEFNNKSQPGGEDLQRLAEERSPKLVKALDDVAIKRFANPDDANSLNRVSELADLSKTDKGETFISNVKARYIEITDAEKNAWKALEEKAGGKLPIDTEQFYKNVYKDLGDYAKEHLTTAQKNQLETLQNKGYLTHAEFEKWRTDLATTMRSSSDGNVRHVAQVIRKNLDELPLKEDQFSGKVQAKTKELVNLGNQARKLTRERYKLLDDIPALKAIAKDARTADEISAGLEHAQADKLLDKFITKGNSNEIKRLLDFAGGEGSDAALIAKLHTLDELKKAATIVDGQGEFAAKSFNKFLHQQLGKRANTILGPGALQDVKEIGDLATWTTHARATGHANVSQSGNVIRKAVKGSAGKLAGKGIEVGLNTLTGGAYSPFIKPIVSEILTGQSIAKSTRPLAGIKNKNYLKDILKEQKNASR